MRKLCSLAGAGLLLGAIPAFAGFQFSYTIEEGSGDLAGNDVFKFYTKNDQLGGQANTISLFGFEIWMKVLGAGGTHKVDFRDLDDDGIADANVNGVGLDPTNPTASFLQLGPLDHPTGDLSRTPPGPDNRFSFTLVFPKHHYSTGSPNSVAQYVDTNEIHVVAINNRLMDAREGRGFLYGVAVVPAGHDVEVRGQVASENANIVDTLVPDESNALSVAYYEAYTAAAQYAIASGRPLGAPPPQPGEYIPFSFVAQAPEPAALSLVGIAMIALRRTRRAR